MRAPYGIEVIEDCRRCPLGHNYLFCNLDAAAVQHLNEITETAVYPKGTFLFVEGQAPRGIYVLCSGEAKLFCSSPEKSLTVRICKPGSVLGLSAVISHRAYEVTAELVEPGQANFISTEAFWEFVKAQRRVAIKLAEQLGRDSYVVHNALKMIALTTSPTERLTKLLLSFVAEGGTLNGPIRIKFPYSQQEAAEMVGLRRETVARVFSQFVADGVLEKKGRHFILHNMKNAKGFVLCTSATSGVAQTEPMSDIEERTGLTRYPHRTPPQKVSRSV